MAIYQTLQSVRFRLFRFGLVSISKNFFFVMICYNSFGLDWFTLLWFNLVRLNYVMLR